MQRVWERGRGKIERKKTCVGNKLAWDKMENLN